MPLDNRLKIEKVKELWSMLWYCLAIESGVFVAQVVLLLVFIAAGCSTAASTKTMWWRSVCDVRHSHVSIFPLPPFSSSHASITMTGHGFFSLLPSFPN